jgi:hypothetical protein
MNTASTTKQDTTSNPWAVQTPYLTDAFSKAQGQSNNAYNGDRVAQFSPEQLGIFQKMVGYGTGSNAAGESAMTGSALTGAGVGGATGALSRLGAFSPLGGTDSNIDAATKYANAAVTPEAVDAAMRDSRRQVSEQALPQIARQSANSGNVMSSRRGISEGIVERGLAEKGLDTSATMRQDAFKTGLGLAENGRQADTNSILDALKAQGVLGSGMASSGVDALGNSITQQGSLFNLANQGGAGGQASDQAQLDNSIGKSDASWDNLAKYFGIVGSQNWGGTSSGTTTKNPSIWETIGGLMSAGGSLMKSDRNVKHDIKRIGTSENGLPIYSYRYKHITDSPVFIGLMAQDVEQVKPEAVTEINGVKHVNYELALAE